MPVSAGCRVEKSEIEKPVRGDPLTIRKAAADPPRALAALIREEGWHSFTARDVRRKQRMHLQDMEAINPALRMLETADLIRLIEVPPGPKGGAPKKPYSVNPVLHEVEA